MNELVTVEEFKNQIWKIEGVKIDVKLAVDRLVRPYNYPKL